MTKHKPPPPTPRAHLLALLATLPDEAFGYVVNALNVHEGGVWPGGLGGFAGKTRAAIADVRAACDAYLDDATRAVF